MRQTLLLTILLAACAAPLAAQGAAFDQILTLEPGWNAVFLEVEPEPATIDVVFAGQPVTGVWGWFPPLDRVEFLADPGDGLRQLAGWRGWHPPASPEAVLTNLYALEAHRSYLIHVDGGAPIAVTVSGKPLMRALRWVPSSFNLTGFHVNPASPPTFASFLASSPAHAGQPIYGLDAQGVWQPLDPAATTIHSGEAYWIYTQGPSEFQGPLEVETRSFEGLEYSAALDLRRLTLRNRTASSLAIQVDALASATPIPFLLRTLDPDSATSTFPVWTPPLAFPAVLSGEEVYVDLGVRRASLASDRAEQLLEVTDGAGGRRLIFAGVTRVHPAAPLPLAGRSGARAFTKVGAYPWAGLWVGEVAINAVSEVTTPNPTPTPTGEPFRMRILLHVDAAGGVKLLKQVIRMWQKGTMKPDSVDPTLQVVDEPGYFVLLTDDTLIPNYSGAELRDGMPVGMRISTVAYAFPTNDVDMTGTFDPATGSLTVTLTLDKDDPTNPFKHRYHPDHDNLDAEYSGSAEEAFTVERVVTLTFDAAHPADRAPPGWGDSEAGGIYEETITGLHVSAIQIAGIFLLRRISEITELNP